VDVHSDRILGFTAFGPEAGELMGTVQAAMLGGVPYPTLENGVFAHPTMTESLKYLFAGLRRPAGHEAEENETADVGRQGGGLSDHRHLKEIRARNTITARSRAEYPGSITSREIWSRAEHLSAISTILGKAAHVQSGDLRSRH